MNHPAAGECWGAVVFTNLDSYVLVLTDGTAGWFPVQFFVEGIAATSSYSVTSFFSGTLPIPVNLSIDEPISAQPESPLVVEPGECPGRPTGEGLLPQIPAFVSGSVTVVDEPAPDGTQVVALMDHPTLGRCWTDAVEATDGSYLILLTTPTKSSSWFPVMFFVDGVAAEASLEITASNYSPGALFTVDLSLSESPS